MRCPWCGSSVMIRGSSWECGWCGNFESLTEQGTNHVDAFLRLSCRSTRNVERFETALNQLVPKNTLLSHFLGKVLLYNISTIIQNAGALPDEKKAAELRTFLTTTTDLKRGESANEVSDFSVFFKIKQLPSAVRRRQFEKTGGKGVRI